MGLDVGDKRTGVALSDPTGMLATPLTTLNRTSSVDEDISAILALAKKHGAEVIVVGIPKPLGGGSSLQMRATERFYRALGAKSPVPVKKWDERFSTLEAERLLREAGVEPSRENGRVDAAAAAVMLQSYLDRPKTRP